VGIFPRFYPFVISTEGRNLLDAGEEQIPRAKTGASE